MLILTCSRAKSANAGPAHLMYVGVYFASLKAYANAMCGDDWYILSAKYGLVHKNEWLEPYNTSFLNPETNPIGPSFVADQFANGKFKIPEKIELLAGGEYEAILRQALPDTIIQAPFREHGINKYLGHQQRACRDAIENNMRLDEWLGSYADMDKYKIMPASDDKIWQWLVNNDRIGVSRNKLKYEVREAGMSCTIERLTRIMNENMPRLM